jgi:transcriptional regulator with XRE-family HTH domain
MSGKRTSVARIEEIQRLLGLGLTERKISKALGVSRNTVARLRRGDEASADPVDQVTRSWTDNVDWERGHFTPTEST